MASSRDDSSSDMDHIAYMIHVTKPFLVRYVKSTDLVQYMSSILKDKESQIRKLDIDGKHAGSTELLLECLKQATDVPGRYAIFRDALRQAGYDHISRVIEGGDMEENQTEHCELLKIFAHPIIERIDPSLVIRHLRQHELLTTSDESEITNCQRQHSREHAVFMLLNLVPRRKTGWYDHLMTTMYQLYPQLVELVDPLFKEKKDAQLGCTQSESMDTDTVMENTISVTEPPYIREKLMDCGELSPKKRKDYNEEEDVLYKRQKTELETVVETSCNINSSQSKYLIPSWEDKAKLTGCEDSVTSSFSSHSSRSGEQMNIPCTSEAASAKKRDVHCGESDSRVVMPKVNATLDTTMTDEQKEELYKKIKGKFVDSIDPQQLSTYINLGPTDDERIHEIQKGQGRPAAAAHLLLTMHQRVPHWIADICKGLRNYNIKLDHIADFIEKSAELILTDAEMKKQNCDSPSNLETCQTSPKGLPQSVETETTTNIASNECESDTDNVDPADNGPLLTVTNTDADYAMSDNTPNDLTSNVSSTCGSSAVEESIQEPEKELNLRPYQEELAQDGLSGINTIICAPTGCGKTFVAVKIMQEHLKKKGVRKIVFFANQVALVEQQFKVIREHVSKDCQMAKVSGENQETMKMSLEDLIARNDILLMTPQILEDGLKNGEVSSLSEFTMLVFDECHHTNSNHVYNQLMFRYMKIKLDETIPEDKKNLPQIVGLTASVGVGKSKDIKGAMEHIKNLCANLDACGGVTTVQINKADLVKYTGSTGTEFQKTEGRKEDIFRTVVSDQLMKTIEEMMRKSNYTNSVKTVKNFADILKPPSEKVEQQYMSWLSNLFREVAKIEDSQARRFFISHRRHLEIYHRSLSINADCQTKDALKRLDEELDKLHPSSDVMDDTDRKLMKLYQTFRPELKSASENPLCINPKLAALRSTILEPFKQETDCRVMVFVKTRDLATALLDWMKEDKELSELKPAIFVGQGAAANKGGMTRHEQLESAEFFRKGDYKIIIATSVAEEGMDFSKCNRVIQYEYVTNEIAMVQARGRARAENSSFIFLSDKQTKGDKGELNMSREIKMNRALIKLQDDIKADPGAFQKSIIEMQQNAKAERDNEAARGGNRVVREGDFAFRCVKCDVLACFSTDIRSILKTHHAVLTEEFQSKIKVKPHPKAATLKDFKIASKITCAECGHDWGVAIIYKNATFPVIKINSFVVIDSYDRRDLPKKWNKAPFLVPEMSAEDFRGYKSLELDN